MPNPGRGSACLVNVRKITKQTLRERILTLLKKQREEERLAKSVMISDKFLRMPAFIKSKLVLFYAPFDGEVDTFEMIKQAQKLGKKIALPRILRKEKKIIPARVNSIERELTPGPYGILQPQADGKKTLSVEELDLVIVPGVAFDKQNNRLGRGGGYYDRFLSTLPSHIPTAGLAFDFQIVNDLPRQKHDVSVSCVLVN